MWDLNVGRDVLIYGKLFRFTSCDPFTRHFLSCEGVIVPPEEPVPENLYSKHRAAIGKKQSWANTLTYWSARRQQQYFRPMIESSKYRNFSQKISTRFKPKHRPKCRHLVETVKRS
jgi:hypothetical protein